MARQEGGGDEHTEKQSLFMPVLSDLNVVTFIARNYQGKTTHSLQLHQYS